MRIVRAVIIFIVVLALAAGAWQMFGRGSARGAELVVSWRGKSPGSMTLPATLNWCPVTRVGVLEAMSGDSGVALLLYERDSLTAGPHTVVSPDMSGAAPKPAASFVMRWLLSSSDSGLAGFRSESGTARIQFAGGKASGDINTRMRSVVGMDSSVVQATFSGVPVVTTAKGCT